MDFSPIWWSCSICKRVFQSKSLLNEHRKKQHLNTILAKRRKKVADLSVSSIYPPSILPLNSFPKISQLIPNITPDNSVSKLNSTIKSNPQNMTISSENRNSSPELISIDSDDNDSSSNDIEILVTKSKTQNQFDTGGVLIKNISCSSQTKPPDIREMTVDISTHGSTNLKSRDPVMETMPNSRVCERGTSTDKKFSCCFCSESFSWLRSLMAHKAKFHSIPKTGESPPKTDKTVENGSSKTRDLSREVAFEKFLRLHCPEPTFLHMGVQVNPIPSQMSNQTREKPSSVAMTQTTDPKDPPVKIFLGRGKPYDMKDTMKSRLCSYKNLPRVKQYLMMTVHDCHLCSEKFSSIQNLRTHLNAHYSGQNTQHQRKGMERGLNILSPPSRNKIVLSTSGQHHLNRQRCTGNIIEDPIFCPTCGLYFWNKWAFVLHAQTNCRVNDNGIMGNGLRSQANAERRPMTLFEKFYLNPFHIQGSGSGEGQRVMSYNQNTLSHELHK